MRKRKRKVEATLKEISEKSQLINELSMYNHSNNSESEYFSDSYEFEINYHRTKTPLLQDTNASSSNDFKENNLDIEEDFFYYPLSSENEDECDDRSETEEKPDVRDFLRNWAEDFNITHAALKRLLQCFSKHHELPLDPRTLMETPASLKDIIPMGSGEYYYFGLLNQIEGKLKCGLKHQHTDQQGRKVLSLKTNIDGIPLFRSSLVQFWPILCILNESVSEEPFTVAVYCGSSKPQSPSIFFKNFIEFISISRI